MTLDGKSKGDVSFYPHWSVILWRGNLLPATAGAVYATVAVISGEVDMTSVFVIAFSAAVSVALLLRAEWKRRRTVLEIGSGLLKATDPYCEKSMRLESCWIAETDPMSVHRLFGGVRVRVFSDSSHRAWISTVLSSESADRMTECFSRYCDAEEYHSAETILSGGFSAAIHAITSEFTMLTIAVAALLTLFGGVSDMMNLLASALLMAAVFNALLITVNSRGLSVCRRQGGYDVTLGLFGAKRLLIPDRSVDGVRVHCSPADIPCGTGTMELICFGGRRIPCICRSELCRLERISRRLTETNAENGILLSDIDALRRKYTRLLATALSIMVPAVYVSFRSEDEITSFFAGTAAAVIFAEVIRCCVGLQCASRFGIKVTPSVVFTGGMSMLGADYCFYKRGSVAGVRMSSPLLMRTRDLCGAAPFPRGGRRYVRGDCIPYSAMKGFADRFC